MGEQGEDVKWGTLSKKVRWSHHVHFSIIFDTGMNNFKIIFDLSTLDFEKHFTNRFAPVSSGEKKNHSYDKGWQFYLL